MTTTTATPRKELVATTNGSRQNDVVRDLVAHAARIQLASLTAASKFLAGWAQAADRYAQAISDELLGRIRGETASGELLGRLASASSQHLREVTTPPNDAVNHFNKELTKKTRKRTRQTAGACSREMRPTRWLHKNLCRMTSPLALSAVDPFPRTSAPDDPARWKAICGRVAPVSRDVCPVPAEIWTHVLVLREACPV